MNQLVPKQNLKIELIQLLKSSPTIDAVAEKQDDIHEKLEPFLNEHYKALGFSKPEIWQQEVFDKHAQLASQEAINSIEQQFVELMDMFLDSIEQMVAAQERKTILSIQGASFILDSLQYKHYFEERDVFKGEFECLYEACVDVINKYNEIQQAKSIASDTDAIEKLDAELVKFAKKHLPISKYFCPGTLQYDETYFALVKETANALQDAYDNFDWNQYEMICYACDEE